jgi:hypothetical protein
VRQQRVKLYATALILVSGLAGQEAKKGEFTARELFYSAGDAAAPAPKPAASKTTTKHKTATQTAAKPAAPAAPGDSTAVSASATQAPAGGARIVKAVAVTAPAPSEGPALGLRYTILKRSGGEMVEVSPDTLFHAGDRIQFSIETNGPGYLYIVSQGSSGTWKPMFPSAEVEDGSNHVDGFHTYTMPPKSRLVFDEQAGTEKIFIVFSRQPEPDLENTIYSLQSPKAKPAAQPQAAPQPKQLLVASVDDSMVGRLRNSYARDLIVEKVDESTPGDRKEKAMYVVNPTGSKDSRVVADLRLAHQ